MLNRSDPARRLPSALAILLIATIPCVHGYACTILAAESDAGMLVGNNEDYYLDAVPKMWVTPGKRGEYGRICFGFNQRVFSRFAQGGVNEAGLFFDAAVTPRGTGPADSTLPKAPSNMGDRMLAECGSVDEAIAWLQKYRLHLLTGSHLMLADASGASCVVELVDGTMQVVPKTESHQAITNFWLLAPERGNHPCPRHAAVERVLAKAANVTVNTVGEALQRSAAPKTYIESEKRFGGTLYSNIYNLDALKIAVFLRGDFTRPAIVDIRDYVSRGKRTYRLDRIVDVGPGDSGYDGS